MANNESNTFPYHPLNTYPTGVSSFQFPTRWTMRQSWMWADMHIKDPFGNKIFRAESKMLSLGWNLQFYDAKTGGWIGQIKQELRLGLPKYSIFLGDEEYGTVKKEFTFRPKFTIQSCEGSISIQGDWLAHSYTFKRGDHTIAKVSKSWAALRNKYTVDISAGENVLFILSCCIVIDKCCTNN